MNCVFKINGTAPRTKSALLTGICLAKKLEWRLVASKERWKIISRLLAKRNRLSARGNCCSIVDDQSVVDWKLFSRFGLIRRDRDLSIHLHAPFQERETRVFSLLARESDRKWTRTYVQSRFLLVESSARRGNGVGEVTRDGTRQLKREKGWKPVENCGEGNVIANTVNNVRDERTRNRESNAIRLRMK